jgi:hypothetical protein
MDQKRCAEIDVLRTVIIMSAFILHYDLRIGLGVMVTPSLFISRYIFTVGGFFFFVAGYMARNVYLPRFAKDPAETSRRIFFKGLKILLIYLSYVLLMRVVTGATIPDNLIAFIFDHNLTMKILFTFSFLFMLTPLILYCATNHNKSFIAMAIALFTCILFYDSAWPIAFEIKILFIDRTLSAYPLMPALLVYAFGYGAGICDKHYFHRLSRAHGVIICLALLGAYALSWHYGLMRNWKCFTLIESITPYLMILLARKILSWTPVKKYLLHPNSVRIGINSLSFYVISNILVGLLQLTHHSPVTLKVIAFATTGGIAYLVTYWYSNSSMYVHSLTKRTA